ncbi:MAG: hypothetical protein ACJAYC_003935 [Halieaceae bacterium]|jgi:hypothetical protein
MKSQFSEFTYGYALTEEMSKTYMFKSVPTFPSLIEEGRVGGYDVSLDISGTPIFLQFKRSDYLSRANAKYYSLFSSQYYRFNLHALKYSKQHNLLLALERKGQFVFYVAPIPLNLGTVGSGVADIPSQNPAYVPVGTRFAQAGSESSKTSSVSF